MLPEGSRDGQRGITSIADQPLEFDADPVRRAGLEADTVNVRLGILLGEPAFGRRAVQRLATGHGHRLPPLSAQGSDIAA